MKMIIGKNYNFKKQNNTHFYGQALDINCSGEPRPDDGDGGGVGDGDEYI